jgi:tetratricopeptide (TPR) repeat protein
VTVQLTDATNGFQLWSDTFDRDSADILEIQDEISRAVVGRVAPASAAGAGPSGPPTHDEQAYDLFLRGQHAMATRTRDGLIAAERYLQEAVGRDPEFSAAWAALAEAVIPLHEIHNVRGEDEAYALATSAAGRALATRAPVAEGHAALAHILWHQYRWRESETEAELAVALNPGSAIGYAWLGVGLLAQGRLAEAEREYRRAVDLDPLGPYHYLLAVILLAGDHPEEALRTAESGLRSGNSIAVLPGVLAHVQLGRLEAAQTLLRNAPVGTPSHVIDGLDVYLLARNGDEAEARRRLSVLVDRLRPEGEPGPMVVPFAYVALGEHDLAVEWLKQSRQAGEFLAELRLTPEMRSLAGNATMREMLKEYSLAAP